MHKKIFNHIGSESIVRSQGMYKFRVLDADEDFTDFGCKKKEKESNDVVTVNVQDLNYPYPSRKKSCLCSVVVANENITISSNIIHDGVFFVSLLITGVIELEGFDKKETLEPGVLAIYRRDDFTHNMRGRVNQILLPIAHCHMEKIQFNAISGEVFFVDRHPLSSYIRSQMVLLERTSRNIKTKAFFSMLDRLYHIALLMLDEQFKSKKQRPNTARDLIYSAAKGFVDQHYGNQDLSPEVICSELKCSRSTLDRAFSENKTSVMSFILKIRLNVARHLIENNHHDRIETIAYQCGFSTPTVFGKAFKTRFGLTPKEWRQEFGCV